MGFSKRSGGRIVGPSPGYSNESDTGIVAVSVDSSPVKTTEVGLPTAITADTSTGKSKFGNEVFDWIANIDFISFDFSSPSNYETDYWDMQTQTVASLYDNGVDTATLNNIAGLSSEKLQNVKNDAGNEYNVWEANSIGDLIFASETTVGNSNNEDFSVRFVFIHGEPITGVKTLVGKLTDLESPGWSLYTQDQTPTVFIKDDATNDISLAGSTTLPVDGAVHVLSVLYRYDIAKLYLKGDVLPETEVDTSSLSGTMTNTQSLRVGASYTLVSTGLQVLFTGVCVGVNAKAYYDEVVVLPLS